MKQVTIYLTSLCLYTATALFAADGTWNVDADGDWSTAGNWNSGTIADGAGSTANFTYDISAARNIAVDSNRTIGNLSFDDGPYYINGPNVLTLDNNGSQPVITCNGNSWGQLINVSLAGNNGFSVSGNIDLILNNNNDVSGSVTCSSKMQIMNENALKNADVTMTASELQIRTINPVYMKSLTLTKANATLGQLIPYWGINPVINTPITLNPDVNWAFIIGPRNQAMTFNSNITLSASSKLGISEANGILTFNAPFSGAGNLTLNLDVWATPSTINLNAENSFAGYVNLESYNSSAGRFELGTNKVFDNCTQLKILNTSGSPVLDMNGYTQTVGTLVVENNSAASIASEITGNVNGVLEVTNSLNFYETAGANATSVKFAGGKLICASSSSFTLEIPLVITNATFIKNNFSAGSTAGYFDLQAGAKIGGDGYLYGSDSATTNLDVKSGATFTPGDNSIGTLTCYNINMKDGSKYDWEVNSTTADLVKANGVLDISDGEITVNVIKAGSPIGGPYTLFTAVGGIVGSATDINMIYEAGIAGPAHPTIVGNDIVATIVPEPGSIAVLSLIIITLLRRK